MKAREEHREMLIEQRVTMLPESFKSYICMANPKEKKYKIGKSKTIFAFFAILL